MEFTKEHKKELDTQVLKRVYDNSTITGTMGIEHTISQLLHECTINTLNNISLKLAADIAKMENLKWNKPNQDLINKINDKEFIDLLIGYRLRQNILNRHIGEYNALKKEKEKLEESIKTPSEKLKALSEAMNTIEKILNVE